MRSLRQWPARAAAAVAWFYALTIGGEYALHLGYPTFSLLIVVFIVAFAYAGFELYRQRPRGGVIAVIMALFWAMNGLRGVLFALVLVCLVAWAFASGSHVKRTPQSSWNSERE